MCRPSVAAREAADDAYADLIRKTVMMRRMHDSVRLRYHKLMRAANAEEAALLHSQNDSIRFLSWLFVVMKVCRQISVAQLSLFWTWSSIAVCK